MPRRMRPANIADAAVLSGLIRRAIAQTNAIHYPHDVILKLLARHGPSEVAAMIVKRDMFCALDGEDIVGTVALEGDQLRGLFVEPSRHGAGFGGMLVKHIEAHAMAKAHKVLWLQASITAHAFYERRGYIAERSVDQDDGFVTIMRKRLG